MATPQPTVEQIESMTYQEMVKAAPQLGVKYSYQKKEELLWLLISAAKGEALPEEAKVEEELSEEIQDILDHPSLNKSEMMRELFDAGITKPSEIAKLVGAHYSFVYSVLGRYKKEKRENKL